MDNKQDKQFYWEVKQFLNTNLQPAVKKQQNCGIKEVSKMIMESNNPYRTSPFHQDITSSEVVGQVLNYLGHQNSKKPINSVAHATTNHTNPFTTLREGIFDTVAANAAKMVATSSLGIAPQQNPASASTTSFPQSFQLPDGTWVDQYGNPIPGSGSSSATSPTSSTTAPGSSPTGTAPSVSSASTVPSGMAPLTATSSGAGTPLSFEDKKDNLMRARAMPRGEGENRSPELRAQARAQREARNAAIAAANIDLRQDRERQKDELNKAREEAKAAREASSAARTGLTSSAREEAGPMPSGTGAPVSVGAEELKRAKEAEQREKEANRRVAELSRQRRRDEDLINPSSASNLGGSRVAVRYADKAAENALPFEDQPISPFYRMSRREFRDTFGRDYDASGGANTNNMMALQNWKTNLSGRLTRAEEDWQGKMVDKAQKEYAMKNRDLLRRANSGDAAAAAEFKRGLDYVTAQARKANPVADYKPSDMDVPPGPGQGMGGRPYSPQAGERTAPTKPVERPLSAADQVALRAGRCPGGICPEDKK